MSIPLDRLYNYLDDLNNRDIIIYRFYPHGSKNIADLNKLHGYSHLTGLEVDLSPLMLFHDQEPLDFDLFETLKSNKIPVNDPIHVYIPGFPKDEIFKELIDTMPRVRLKMADRFNFHDKLLLCHSEKNSIELEKYSKEFIGVYYWSHALIARDWFRFAKHDVALKQSQTYNYDFLIYNRAWEGTREYRLKFAEMLISNNLQDSCLTSFSPEDSSKHYTKHIFKNPALKIISSEIEQHLPLNTHNSCASADYNGDDYNQCGIEIVLETLFDDQRLHLTEKTLRPIAVGKPFILAATAGSLEYLRSYGFETFGSIIDETYDSIPDSLERLNAIISEMSRIQKLPAEKKIKVWKALNQIAQRNKTLFFDDNWQQQIINEYLHNRDLAMQECQAHRKATWRIKVIELLSSNGIEPSFPLTEKAKQILFGKDSV